MPVQTNLNSVKEPVEKDLNLGQIAEEKKNLLKRARGMKMKAKDTVKKANQQVTNALNQVHEAKAKLKKALQNQSNAEAAQAAVEKKVAQLKADAVESRKLSTECVY